MSNPVTAGGPADVAAGEPATVSAGGPAEASAGGDAGDSAGAIPADPSPPDPLKAISSLSYTGLSELERCGYRFYLERVLGLSERDPAQARGQPIGSAHDVLGAPGERLDARARGQLVHRVLQSIDFARPGPISEDRVAGAARLTLAPTNYILARCPGPPARVTRPSPTAERTSAAGQ